MKKQIILFIFSVSLLASCTLETSGNGDLDGYWHLIEVDTLTVLDDSSHTRDLSQQLVFWAFQNNLMMTVDHSGGTRSFFFRFAHVGDSLIVSDPYINDRDDGDIQCTDPTQLYPYGIHNLREAFYIESLSSSHMELRSADLWLKFRKQ